MKITLNNKKPLVFLGDIHGEWRALLKNMGALKNHIILCVGDLEIGCKYNKKYEIESIKKLNTAFAGNDIEFYSIRGNHDNPAFFSESSLVELPNFNLLPDYTLLEHKTKTILAIGGATSIDRAARNPLFNYWPTEAVSFQPQRCTKVDILLTHTAPSFCHPNKLTQLVQTWAKDDATLIEEIQDEREKLNTLFQICQPTTHLYGHFHQSHTEQNNGCQHILLDILEIWRYPLTTQ